MEQVRLHRREHVCSWPDLGLVLNIHNHLEIHAMTPTNHLRFVERQKIVSHDPINQTTISSKTKVLQQFFEHPNGKHEVGTTFEQKVGSWIDIPLVAEQ